MVLRHHGDLSHRGPVSILVIWIAIALLSAIWLHTSISLDKWKNAAILVSLHGVYFLSLVFKGSSTYVRRRAMLEIEVGSMFYFKMFDSDIQYFFRFSLNIFKERQSLLGTNYVRFHDDIQMEALGQAQDDAPWLSKLLFYWVNPLIDKGLSGNLKSIDDLFDLPESLSISNTAERLQNAITQTISLFRALHRVFGLEFYSIGLLRFLADMLSFTGPILLNGLLSHKSSDQTETDLKSYAYAFGLFATTLIGKIQLVDANTFFNECNKSMNSIFRCIHGHSFQLANVINKSEDANGHHNSHIS